MDLFRYLMTKNGHNYLKDDDLFSYKLAKGQGGTYAIFEGTTINAENTRRGKMKLSLKGNTSQTGTPTPDNPIPVNVVSGDNEVVVTGSQLFDASKYTTLSSNGITATINNGEITLNGTSTATAYIGFNLNNTIPSGTIVSYGANNSLTMAQCYLNLVLGDVTKEVVQMNTQNCKRENITLSSDINRVFIQIGSGITLNNFKIKPMINIGATLREYGPYQSSTYPINLPVENLWNEEWENGYWNRTTGEKGSGNSYLRCKDYQPITPNTDIYFNKPSEYINFAVIFYDSSKQILNSGTSAYVDSRTYTTPSNASYFTFFLDIGSGSGTATYNNNIMINLGNKPNSYTPYGTTPIEMCDINDNKDKFIRNSGKNLVDSVEYNKYVSGSGNVTSGNTDYLGINDFVSCKPNTTYAISFEHDNSSGQLYVAYKDIDNNFISRENYSTNRTFTTPNNAYYLFVYIYKSSTFTTIGGYVMLNEGSTPLPYEPYGANEWYKESKIGKVVLDGSEEGWVATTSDTIKVPNTISSLIKRPINQDTLPYVYCSHLTTTTWNANWNNLTSFIAQATQNDDMRIRVSNPNMSLADFKTWLSNNNLILYYVLNTPTYTKIEGTLAEQLNALQNSRSYDGQTNINQNNNDLASNMEAQILVNE